MTALFSPLELSSATGGLWLHEAPESALYSITTDTRCDNRGKIFFALSGDRFDAHDFLRQAIDSGCAALCISRKKNIDIPKNIPVLVVDDTLIAMQSCAAFHRRRFPELTLFCVTGSVGKTSVKEMLRAICASAAGTGCVLATEGNTNNQIGVAQNLLRLSGEHRFAVIEAGTSSHGEILPLSRMAAPAGAIVNSIAPCHLENLIDLDGVAREKGTVFSFLSDNGVAVFPAETAGKIHLEKAAFPHRTITFGIDGKGDVQARFISGKLDESTFQLTFPDGKIFTVSWNLTGQHNALNAAGAAALAYACGISPEIICSALPDTILPGMRMKKTILNDVTYFNDAYNANPASMHASVELLSQVDFDGNLFLVLGGMRELGTGSEAAHKELLAEIKAKLPHAKVITTGKEFENLSACHFSSPEDAGNHLQSMLAPGDTVFAKGSRGNCVEKALPSEAR